MTKTLELKEVREIYAAGIDPANLNANRSYWNVMVRQLAQSLA